MVVTDQRPMLLASDATVARSSDGSRGLAMWAWRSECETALALIVF